MKRAWSFGTCLLLFLAPAALLAQAQTTGNVRGAVVDDAGAPIADAAVTLRSQELGIERVAATGERGDFLFARLPVGTYALEVTREGMQPQAVTFTLAIGETKPLEVTLSTGETVAEEVTVYGTASKLETPAEGETFDYETEVEELPIQNRDIENVAAYSPNISVNNPTANTISISGAPSYDTTVLLDGSEVSDPYFGSAPTVWIEDAVDEVQVLTSGISARYGRFQGGVINAVTKSGSNEFEASARAEFANEDWDSQTPYGEPQIDDVQQTYQATLGGYFLRDRAWFFGGVYQIPDVSQARSTVTGPGGAAQSFTRTDTEERWQGKVRGALGGGNHILELSHLSYESEVTGYDGLLPGDLDAGTGVRRDPRETDTFAYQGVFGQNLFGELQLTRKNVEIVSGGSPDGGDPFGDISGELSGNVVVFNNHWWDASDPSIRDNETAAANLLYSLDAGRAGLHTLEGGVQWVNSITAGDNRQSSTGLNLLPFTPGFFAGYGPDNQPRFNLRTGEAVRWEALTLGGEQALENLALYVQDTIRWRDWRFDVGLRYETYEGSGPLPQFNVDVDAFVPRLGLTYDMTDDWQVLGTYGRYVARLNDNYTQGVTGVASGPSVETLYLGPTLTGATAAEVQEQVRNDANWTVVTDYTHPSIGNNLLADDVEAPYADEITFSLRNALPRGSGSVTVTYAHRDYENLLEDYQGRICDLAPVYGFEIPADRPCPAADVTPVVFEGQVVGQLDTSIVANNPDAERRYDALSLTADYRPSATWSFGGNYTYSQTRGNYEGEGGNTPASFSIQGDIPLALPPLSVIAPYGNTDDDVPHRLQLFGIWRHDFGRAGDLSIGSIYRYRSGRRWSRVATIGVPNVPQYVSADNSGSYTYYFDGRGNEQFDDWWALDLSVGHEIQVFGDLDLLLEASALNVTNQGAVVTHQTSATGPLVNGQRVWTPAGNCGVNSEPSRDCSGFGRIRNENDYQLPRQFLFTLGLRW